MKKTRRKHLFRTIRKTGVSFFAVAFIAGTSIGIFQGLQSAADAILDKADSYFNSNNLETLERKISRRSPSGTRWKLWRAVIRTQSFWIWMERKP